MITGIGVHDPPESVFTIDWNLCSRSNGIRVHDPPESAVYEAIRALEAADVLTWVNRIVREQVRERDLFGNWGSRWRIVRTSNAYTFRDPLPCSEGRGVSKSENPAGTLNQDISTLKKKTEPSPAPLTDLGHGLLKALHGLGTAIAVREGLTVT
jgi:hypothetical protein